MKCSGVPSSFENAAAFGNSRFNCASGFGLVKIRSAASTTAVQHATTDATAANVFNTRLLKAVGQYN